MRIAEVVALKVSDVDSKRMTLRFEQGKGHKDRYAMLSPVFLEPLRAWWRYADAQQRMLKRGRLFPAQNPINHISARQLSRACQAAARDAGIDKTALRWLEARQRDILPVAYYHLVFTLPAQISSLAYHNKALLYDILLKTAASTLCMIAADPRHLGARIGATLVLHTWGSAMTHHPHVHGIVPGGGLSLDGERWVACRPGFFLPVRVLSRRFRRLFLEQLGAAYTAGKLQLFGAHQALAEPVAFADWIRPLRKMEWVVYTKRPFAGPQATLAYLSRYTHRVAIANSRLITMNAEGVTFKWKDYRNKGRTHRSV